MKVFVTGASGFIGSAFARALLEAGHDVIAFVRSAERARDLEGAGSNTGTGTLEILEGDVASEESIESARPQLESADAVAHLAAVRKDWALSDDELRRANVDSGPHLMRRATSAKRYLYVSSVAVHGHTDGSAANEESPIAPSKRYGRSKVEAEAVLRDCAEETGIPLTIARPGITYGPGDTYGLVANIARLVARKRFLLVGNGRNRLNVLHVRDLAVVLISALTKPEAEGETFILTGRDAMPLRDLLTAVETATERRIPPVRVPEACARLCAWLMEGAWRAVRAEGEPFLTKAKVDIMTCEDVFNTSKAQRMLDYSPAISLQDGINESVRWMDEVGEL